LYLCGIILIHNNWRKHYHQSNLIYLIREKTKPRCVQIDINEALFIIFSPEKDKNQKIITTFASYKQETQLT